jgi:uncharacterized Tic20 family protein
LAKALHVTSIDLLPQESDRAVCDNMAQVSENLCGTKENNNTLKLLNLSAIFVVLIPLSNIAIPAIIFWKNRNNEAVNTYGRNI